MEYLWRAGSVPGDLHRVTHLISMTTWYGRYCYYSHVTDGMGNNEVGKYGQKHATCEWYVPNPSKLWSAALEAFPDSLDSFPKQTTDIVKQILPKEASKGIQRERKNLHGLQSQHLSFTSADYQWVQDLILWHLGLFDLRPNSDTKVTRDLGPLIP